MIGNFKRHPAFADSGTLAGFLLVSPCYFASPNTGRISKLIQLDMLDSITGRIDVFNTPVSYLSKKSVLQSGVWVSQEE